MSLSATKLVWEHSRATGSARLVMLALADYANDCGECWPSLARLAQMCRIDVRSVRRNLASLEAAGEIVRRFSTGRKTTYQIALTPDAGVTPDAAVTPDTSVPTPRTLASETPDTGVPLSVKNHYKNHTPPIVPPCNGADENEPGTTGRSETPDDGEGGGMASATDGDFAEAGTGERKPGGDQRDTWKNIRLTAARRDIARANGIAADEIDGRFADFITERQASAGMVREPDEDWRRYCAKHGRHRSPNGASAGGRSRASLAFGEALARRQAQRLDVERNGGNSVTRSATGTDATNGGGCGEASDPLF